MAARVLPHNSIQASRAVIGPPDEAGAGSRFTSVRTDWPVLRGHQAALAGSDCRAERRLLALAQVPGHVRQRL